MKISDPGDLAVFGFGLVAMILLFGASLLGCEDRPIVLPGSSVATAPMMEEQWEYKVFVIAAPTHERQGENALASNELIVDNEALNKMGLDHWELTTSWLEMETAYPNLGKASYVTGLNPNVRPMRAVLLFKRRILPR